MTFKRNWNFLSFPILDSYLIAKLLLGYDIICRKPGNWNPKTG